MTDSLSFRDATADDMLAIVRLLHDDVNGRLREDVSEPLHPGYAAAFAAIEADANQRLIVAELNGRVVGTMQLSFLPGLSFRGAWRGQIENVRIASDLRGSGLGARMIDWALEQCRVRRCRFAQLMSQNDRVDAHRFYTRLGWKKSHAGFKIDLTERA